MRVKVKVGFSDLEIPRRKFGRSAASRTVAVYVEVDRNTVEQLLTFPMISSPKMQPNVCHRCPKRSGLWVARTESVVRFLFPS